MMMMNDALMYLSWAVLFTALLWIPYILNTTMVRGLADTVGYPENPKPIAKWAQRAKSAHYNAVENLVVMAPLVIAAQMMGVSNDATAQATLVYLLARIVHYFVYMAGIPWVRTLSFVVGWVCTVIVAVQVLF